MFFRIQKSEFLFIKNLISDYYLKQNLISSNYFTDYELSASYLLIELISININFNWSTLY